MQIMTDLLRMSLLDAAAAIRSKQVSSLELTVAAFVRAKQLQPRLNIFARMDEEDAMATARARDADLARGRLSGPLHGVPLAHKDMFYRAGRVSTCGSKIRADWCADRTATVLERLDAAGAVHLGTLNMTELAYTPVGQNAFLGNARNPWNPECITGGSSSGSAVAVATRIVFGALGSDTGGSIRLPASICGVVGMKPTYSRVSRAAAMPLSHSLDTIGPLTRTVQDNAALLNIVAGPDDRDGTCSVEPVPDYRASADEGIKKSLSGLRLGIPRGYFDARVEPETARLLAGAAESFRSLGASLVDVEMPDLDAVNAAGLLLTWGDVLSLHGPWMRERSADYASATKDRIEVALACSTSDYIDAQRVRGRLLREFAATVFGACHAVLAPVLSFGVPTLSALETTAAGGMVPIVDEMTRLTRPMNTLGIPSLSLPCGFTVTGMPCGMQIIGRPFSEALLYRIGAAYQTVTDWHERPPPT